MSYTRPLGNAADASWVGASAYTRPAGNAADVVTWQDGTPTVIGRVSVPSPLGAPALLGVATPATTGIVSAPSPLGVPSLVGHYVVGGIAAAPSPLGTTALTGAVVLVGQAAVPGPLGAPAAVGTVVRYELRGEVRDQGVLVNRRVRAYLRETGALVGESDTVAGQFAVPVGFAADEYYVLPIDLGSAAADFSPPCANRVASVLAMDVVS